jgi:catechol 2,3-dioxygenase-like lactoylglutathione lyase family enzyme
LTNIDALCNNERIDQHRYFIDRSEGVAMSRVQLALNVTDIDAAVDFYGKLFGAEPAKRRPGYANFAIDQPPLKLVLIEAPEGGTINHLGVELADTEEVSVASDRLVSSGLVTREEMGVECCYALQVKVWVNDPDGAPWEWYAVLADSKVMGPTSGCCGGETACC